MANTRGSAGLINPWSVSLLFAVLMAIHIILILAFGLDDDRSVAVTDIFLPIESLVALAAVWYGARRTSLQDKVLARAWYVITISIVAWFLGEASWSFIELGLKQNPFPSIADVFYVLYYPLIIVGIILIPRTPLKDVNQTEYTTYSSLLVIAISLVFWFFLINPLFAMERPSYIIFVFSVLYPLCDLILLNTVLVLFLLMLRKQSSGPIWCLAISTVLMTITDSIFGIQEIKGIFTGGNLLDVGWSFSLAFMALAGAFQGRTVERLQ
jgi:two-component system, sensor histidine kinase PdtaS